MTLNHLNLTVTDVRATRAFLEKYFGLTTQGGAEGNAGFCLLRDDSGMALTLMKGSDVSYPRTFHIGFGQPSEKAVDEINARLKADGFDVNPPERSHAYTFYVTAPGGFTVEVMG